MMIYQICLDEVYDCLLILSPLDKIGSGGSVVDSIYRQKIKIKFDSLC